MVAFTYNGTGRVAEPYSLRRAQSTGNILLYAWQLMSDHIKAFNVAKIYDLRITDRAFHPRYNVELSPASQVLPVTVGMSGRSPSLPLFSNVRPRIMSIVSGPTYVFVCPICNKKFRHSKYDATLRRHKNEYGWYCSSTRGYCVDTEYSTPPEVHLISLQSEG